MYVKIEPDTIGMHFSFQYGDIIKVKIVLRVDEFIPLF